MNTMPTLFIYVFFMPGRKTTASIHTLFEGAWKSGVLEIVTLPEQQVVCPGGHWACQPQPCGERAVSCGCSLCGRDEGDCWAL